MYPRLLTRKSLALYLLCSLWLVGILLPMARLVSIYPWVRRAFATLFSPGWMHIAMHAVLYMVLAVLLMKSLPLPQNRNGMILLLGVLLVVGITQEWLQMLGGGNPGLGGILFDLCVDLCGGLAGGLFLFAVMKVRAHSP